MLFDSFQYWIFFVAILLLVLQVGAIRARVALVLGSLLFYAFWDPRFVLLLLGATVMNYWLGLGFSKYDGVARRRWLAFAVVLNLSILAFFKYFNFFSATIANVFSLDEKGLYLTIVLPVGISFFTFEGVAYNVDIFRRDIEARKSFRDYALFMAFFPHLVAGPIIRPHNFFPQLTASSLRISADDFRWGVVQIVKGLIKKLVFADAAATFADAYFNGTGAFSAATGVIAFGLQIYFDFAGYTDIARGCARLLGFKFPPNFERPYLSSNIAEFWRTWHISLSSWLRDYLYVPLGGNRLGVVRTYVNLMIVMGLGGLWHGASWNFVIWGLYHGVCLAVHRAWRNLAPRSVLVIADSPVGGVVFTVITTIVVFIGWIPFRAGDITTSIATVGALLTADGWFAKGVPAELIVLSVVPLGWCWVDRGRRLQRRLVDRAGLLQFSIGAGVMLWLLALFMKRGSSVPFIYFQF